LEANLKPEIFDNPRVQMETTQIITDGKLQKAKILELL